ncbi:MAG: ribosome modulation factor [Reinekea sp.]|jgi:ribosome modulation factor
MAEPQWTLESLNKSYQQGYMTGLAGKEEVECPYKNDILIAAWEAGWDDGFTQYQKAMKGRRQVSYAS